MAQEIRPDRLSHSDKGENAAVRARACGSSLLLRSQKAKSHQGQHHTQHLPGRPHIPTLKILQQYRSNTLPSYNPFQCRCEIHCSRKFCPDRKCHTSMHFAEIVIAQQGNLCTGFAQLFPGNAQENTVCIAQIFQNLQTFLCGTHRRLQKPSVLQHNRPDIQCMWHCRLDCMFLLDNVGVDLSE